MYCGLVEARAAISDGCVVNWSGPTGIVECEESERYFKIHGTAVSYQKSQCIWDHENLPDFPSPIQGNIALSLLDYLTPFGGFFQLGLDEEFQKKLELQKQAREQIRRQKEMRRLQSAGLRRAELEKRLAEQGNIFCFLYENLVQLISQKRCASIRTSVLSHFSFRLI